MQHTAHAKKTHAGAPTEAGGEPTGDSPTSDAGAAPEVDGGEPSEDWTTGGSGVVVPANPGD